MGAHPIQWHGLAPLWTRFGATSQLAVEAPDQFRPAILRFSTDDFMDQMIGTLARDPAQLGNLLARPETWRSQTPDGPDLVERVAVPRVAQTAARARIFLRAKPPVPSVPAKADVVEQTQTRSLPLKLYQPAHQRYYLVSASLVCRAAGLPERAVTQGGSEEVKFVLRRLLPDMPGSTGDASLREFAFVKALQGARWQRVAADDDAAQLAPGEELLPLFPLAYRDESDHKRTLWTGLIPVARREEYFGAAIDRTAIALAAGQRQSLQPAVPETPKLAVTARMTQFKLEVAEPWKSLVRTAYTAKASLDTAPEGLSGGESSPDRLARILALNLQWQMQSWLILLDFADYLSAYLPDVWAAIETGTGAGALGQNRKALYDWLGTAAMSSGLIAAMQNPAGNTLKSPSTSLREALKAVRQPSVRKGLERTDRIYTTDNVTSDDWPSFHFLLSGIDVARQIAGAFTAIATLATPPADDAQAQPAPETQLSAGQIAAETLDRLTALVVRALDSRVETDVPPVPFALQLRDSLTASIGDPGWYVIRCVYLNRDCGPLHPPALSPPTQRFQLANFFDSDAPARPIRITLPLDTTPAGMRKHAKGTAFAISDVLCGQLQRIKGLGFVDLVCSVLPWPFHKDLNLGVGGACKNGGTNIGMICSLSIPIVTICALILLVVIVSLLDFIFRWLPYFVFCFPLPKFKAKNGGGA